MASIKMTLWSKFSKKIREKKANHQGYVYCESCGRVVPWQETDCGHFIENTERTKTFGGNALWFDPRNFGAQCKNCNRFDTGKAKRLWTFKFLQEFGEDTYQELISLKQVPKKWTREEIENIINKI